MKNYPVINHYEQYIFAINICFSFVGCRAYLYQLKKQHYKKAVFVKKQSETLEKMEFLERFFKQLNKKRFFQLTFMSMSKFFENPNIISDAYLRRFNFRWRETSELAFDDFRDFVENQL